MVWKWKAAGGSSVGMCCLVGKFHNTCKSFVLRCCWKTKKKVPHGSWCCSQLSFCVVLTFLQLNHPVIVLKEGIIAECVCKQHLKKKSNTSKHLAPLSANIVHIITENQRCITCTLTFMAFNYSAETAQRCPSETQRIIWSIRCPL